MRASFSPALLAAARPSYYTILEDEYPAVSGVDKGTEDDIDGNPGSIGRCSLFANRIPKKTMPPSPRSASSAKLNEILGGGNTTRRDLRHWAPRRPSSTTL